MDGIGWMDLRVGGGIEHLTVLIMKTGPVLSNWDTHSGFCSSFSQCVFLGFMLNFSEHQLLVYSVYGGEIWPIGYCGCFVLMS